MNDKELIERFEIYVMYKMFLGCEVDDHLHHKTYDVGSWLMTMRADELCRLLDLAKEGLKP